VSEVMSLAIVSLSSLYCWNAHQKKQQKYHHQAIVCMMVLCEKIDDGEDDDYDVDRIVVCVMSEN